MLGFDHKWMESEPTRMRVCTQKQLKQCLMLFLYFHANQRERLKEESDINGCWTWSSGQRVLLEISPSTVRTSLYLEE